GVTQVALATHFNISKSAVNQWESGKNIPDQRKMAELAFVLDIQPARLVELASKQMAGRPTATLTVPPLRDIMQKIVRDAVRAHSLEEAAQHIEAAYPDAAARIRSLIGPAAPCELL